MSIWMLALILWVVVVPVVVVAFAFVLSMLLGRSPRSHAEQPRLADVVPLEPIRRERARSVAAGAPRLRSDHTAPVA